MGLYQKIKAMIFRFFGKNKNDQSTELLQESSENIKMNKNDIANELNKLSGQVTKMEKKSGFEGQLTKQLNKQLLEILIELNNLTDKNISGLNQDLITTIETECTRVSELNISIKKTDIQHSAQIKDENNDLLKKAVVEPVLTNKNTQRDESVQPHTEEISPLNSTENTKEVTSSKNNDTSADGIITLVNKIDMIPGEIGTLLKVTNGYVKDAKRELNNHSIGLNNSIKTIQSKVDDNKQLSIANTHSINTEIAKISKSIPNDILTKGDFSFELSNKFRELDALKEVAEELESLPAHNKFIKSELTTINEKLDNISAPSASKKSSVKVPEEVQAVEDLAKYMRDGLDQFENMSRLYVSKISELENLEKTNQQHQAEILEAAESSFEQGQLKGKVVLAKEIAEKFPSEFKAIKSIFENITTEKYNVGDIINVTNDTKNEMMPYISTALELADYQVITPVVLIDGDIIFKADVKKVTQPVSEAANEVTKSIADSQVASAKVAEEN